ncbi:MAG: hypothetical protein O3C40_33690 [Planctomycetota bacterium]|nr:hypothetical protein [Planctomycetota bacterium]
MEKLHEWSCGKPPLLVMFASQVVSSAADCHGLLEMCRGALEKLVRLDRRVIHHADLQGLLHPSDVQEERDRFAMVSAAVEKGLTELTEVKSVKYALAGQISVVSELLHHGLKPREIRAPFDACACDLSEGRLLCDSELAPGDEAFGKAVRRARKMWEFLLLPDTFSLCSVHETRSSSAASA